MSLDGFLRNLKVVGNDLVGVARSYLPQDIDFTLRQCIVGMMLRQFDGDFSRDSFSATMHCPNRFNQFLPQHVFQEVAVGACFECPVGLGVAAISGQHDNACVRKFPANCNNRFTATHDWHPQVHQRNVRTMSAELLDRVASISRFPDKDHVRLARENRSDPFAEYRMIVYGQNSNLISSSHHLPTQIPQQFSYMLSYSKVLPEQLPEFYRYLLAYPKNKPANVEDTFYWARVKFGLKPTLRVVQMVTMQGEATDPVAYAIAEKQLYSSHYFETALDLSFCVRRGDNSKQPGFYLIMAMGSEQAGLTGVKGSIVRKTAVGRSVSNLQNALTTIRDTLEAK